MSHPKDATGDDGSAGAGAGASDAPIDTGNCEASRDGNTTLIPSSTGWVDHADLCNDVGVQGAWFAYGDRYENGNRIPTCLVDGDHDPSECAQVTTPDPTVMSFPNENGFLHTIGTAELVLACVAGSNATLIPTSGCFGDGVGGGWDFYNMWGAGIGFDFNTHASPPWGDGKRSTWDPSAYGVIGIEFTIEGAPGALRVEFPMLLTADEAAADTPPVTADPPTTDTHTAGAPFWGAHADSMFGYSPVVEGKNVITWDQVMPPKALIYDFDTTRLLGIRFHVPASKAGSLQYDFTISKFRFLRHL